MIDGHTHMLLGSGGPGTRRESVADLKEIDFAELFEKMDEAGIDMMVTVVQETMRVWKDWTGSNELAIDLQEKFPDRILGVFGAEPLDDRNLFKRKRLSEFKSAVREHGIRALGFVPPYGHFQANDRRVYPFYEAATELDVAVYFHQGGGVGGGGGAAYRAPLKYARPILLDDVVIDFPDLRIHVEHMAYPWTEELLALMKHAPNVYTDVTELFSRPTTLAWYLMMAKEYGVIERVVWGSDYDVLWYPERGLAGYFEKVERETSWLRTEMNQTLSRCGWPTLSQSEVDGILGMNARRFLRLT